MLVAKNARERSKSELLQLKELLRKSNDEVRRLKSCIVLVAPRPLAEEILGAAERERVWGTADLASAAPALPPTVAPVPAAAPATSMAHVKAQVMAPIMAPVSASSSSATSAGGGVGGGGFVNGHNGQLPMVAIPNAAPPFVFPFNSFMYGVSYPHFYSGEPAGAAGRDDPPDPMPRYVPFPGVQQGSTFPPDMHPQYFQGQGPNPGGNGMNPGPVGMTTGPAGAVQAVHNPWMAEHEDFMSGSGLRKSPSPSQLPHGGQY